ncbi:uncharacterized protein LOC128234488 [Mya arenaria]|uniref:uncharacterized protein LOC128234488 n=1 Tax=Mya arenaria TaxID=6604 RepID=UPI0022E011C3|nr:uncharacterized protein LOC128234488 [Mya arenaria]
MEGNPSSDFTCRLCLKRFMYFSDLSVHERMHLEQLGYGNSMQGPVRPVSERSLPPALNPPNSQAGSLESFDKLVQPYRTPLNSPDVRQQLLDPRAVVSPTGSEGSAVDMQTLNRNNSNSRDPLVALNQEGLNAVPASPSTDSVRSMIASSPADQRNYIASSPADPRGGFPASPLESRNFVPHSPAGDQRSMMANSPIDQRIPADLRKVNATQQYDVRNIVPSSPADGHNMLVHSPADRRNMVAHSPAEQRTMMASSPIDQRLNNVGLLDQMTIQVPGDPHAIMVQSPVDHRGHNAISPADPRALVNNSVADQRSNAIQSIVADIQTFASQNSVEAISQPSAMPQMYRREEGQGFQMVHPRSMESHNSMARPVHPRSMESNNSMAGQVHPRSMESNNSMAGQVHPRSMESHNSMAGQVHPRSMESHNSMAGQVHPRSMENHNSMAGQVHPRSMVSQNRMVGPVQPQSMEIHNSMAGPFHPRSMESNNSMTRQVHPQSMDSHSSMAGPHHMSTGTSVPNNMGQDGRSIGMNNYSGPSFLESLYDIPGKPPPNPYATTPMSMAGPGPPIDNRNFVKPGLDGQGLTKPDTNYAINKLLNSPPLHSPPLQTSYYQQSYPAHAPPRYDMSGSKGPSGPVNYVNYNQPAADPSAKVEQILHNPRQTIHYGQPNQPGHLVPQNNHSQYQDTIPTPDLQQNQLKQKPPAPYQSPTNNSTVANPVPVSRATEQMQGFMHQLSTSTNTTQSHFHKGSQSHTQIHTPLPTRPQTKQVSNQPAGYVNPVPRSEVICYICNAPFINMIALSEHMKGHAQGMVNQNVATPTQPFNHVPNSVPNQGQTYNRVQSQQPKKLDSVPVSNQKVGNTITNVVEFKCEVCSKSFPKQNMLTEHMKIHASLEKFECSICKKQFKSKLKCARHEKVHQRDVRLMHCEFCEAGFEFKGNYLDHVLKKHADSAVDMKELKTREPTVGTKKAVPLTGGSIDRSFESVESETEKCLSCQVCDQEIECEKLVEHLKTHPMIKCEKCDQVFIHKTEYVAHLMSKHRNELHNTADANIAKAMNKAADSGKEKVVSAVKEKKEKISQELQPAKKGNDSKKKESDKDSSVTVKKNSQQAEEVKAKKESKKRKSNAKISKGIIYDNDVEEKGNNEEVEKVPDVVESKYYCYECSTPFTNQTELSDHFLTHEKDPSRFYCEICFLSYHHRIEKGYYIYHMNYHCDDDLMATTQPENIQCNVCHKMFSKQTLVTHIRKEHAVYSCDICEWSYSTEKVLVNHMRKCHPKEHKNYAFVKKAYNPRVLEYNKQTSDQADLNEKDAKQIEEKTAPDPDRTIPCSMCDKMFSKKHYLDRHMLSHSSIEKTQVACELCNEVFLCKGTYLYHVQFHAELNSDAVKHEETVCKISEVTHKTEVKAEVKDDKTELKVENEVKTEVKSESKTLDMKGPKPEIQPKTEESSVNNNTVKDELKPVKDEEVKYEKVKEKKSVTTTILNPLTGNLEEQTIEESDNEPGVSFDPAIFESDSKENSVEKEIGDNKEADVKSKVFVMCKLCSRKVSKSELSQHMKSHDLHNCFHCEFSYVKLKKYIEHRQALHLDEYIADEIKRLELLDNPEIDDSKSLNESNHGEKDVAKRKRGAKLLNCSLCNTELKQDKCIEHLKSHIKPVYFCEFCKRPYSKQLSLKMHEKSHERIAHSRTELPHPKVCPVCDCRIESRSAYMVHVQSHRRKGTSPCNLCELVFLSEKNLDNHMKVYHDSQIKVYWKHDGEGLKFDLRTGRVGEAMSDHLLEIREINELLKQNGRPEIMHKTTPKKYRERSMSSKGVEKFEKKIVHGKRSEVSESEAVSTVTEEDKVKSDTSDEEYVPDEEEEEKSRKRQSGRVVKKVESEKHEESPPVKKRRSVRSRKETESVESDNESSTKEYIPRGTRSRDVKNDEKKKKSIDDSHSDIPATDKKSLKRNDKNSSSKQVGRRTDFTVTKSGNKLIMRRTGRVLRSSLERKISNPHIRKLALKRKLHVPLKATTRRLRGDDEKKGQVKMFEDEDGEFPEKCADCGTCQFSKRSYDEHCRIHSGEQRYKCPKCDESFRKTISLKTHIQFKHKGFMPRNLKKCLNESTSPVEENLRARTRNIVKDLGSPVASSTPKRSPKLVVRLSPIDGKEKIGKIENKKQIDSANKSSEKASEKLKNTEIICHLCNKTYCHQSNLARHIRLSHRTATKPKSQVINRSTRKKEEESYPFSCKDCSESFKKKRDLYIHTKVHQVENTNETNDLEVDTSEGPKDDESKETEDESMKQEIAKNNPDADTNETQPGCASKVSEKLKEKILRRNLQDGVGSKEEKESEDDRSSLLGKRKVVEDASTELVQRKRSRNSNVSDSAVAQTSSDKVISGETVDEDDESEVGNEKVRTDEVAIGNSSSQENSGCENNDKIGKNEDLDEILDDKRADTDSDDRKTPKSQVPFKKISAENALQKWRNKVKETLASQLELNANKKQEQIENPEITRVKEKLSTKLKCEVKNFECRICGDKCNDEEKFRAHMEEHLYESPPYCSICDIYFMAIYPKKRLAEHNRKKHPIVL